MNQRLIQSILLFIALALMQTAGNAQYWSQLGQDIDGETFGDNSGGSISLSADGLTLAIGARRNDGNGDEAGHVRVYRYTEGIWTQQGADIDGEAAADESGGSVSLSADGLTVAIGATYNDGNVNMAGHVRVYKLISEVWTQLGADIDGEGVKNYSGQSVSLSSDGLRLAVGANRAYGAISFSGNSSDGISSDIGVPNIGGNGLQAGHVRIYEFNQNHWTQLGEDIDGEAAFDSFGSCVNMSADGYSIAIGAPYNDGNGIFAGHARVYKLISGEWIQQGEDIDGEAAGDQFGSSVFLSDNGLSLAIGAPYNNGNGLRSGHTRVYKFLSGEWIQQGEDIDGEAAYDESGISVSLSADGLTLAIGAGFNSGSGNDAGNVRVYSFISDEWIQQGPDIDGEAADDLSGVAVSLSADGLNLAIGAPQNSGNEFRAGHVRVFNFDSVVNIDNNKPLSEITIYPNPTTKLANINLGQLKDVTIQVFNLKGQVVYSKTGISTATQQFELNEAAGIYILEISSEGEIQRFKLVKE